ncbi:hypothetical protein PV325_004262 [Microctonus aethiopoides]|nr:hypothetical protein PV325_004262 [Microctonus aethiopoides]
MTEKKSMNIMPKGTYTNGIWTGLKIKQPEGYFRLGEKLLNELKKHPEVIGQIDGETEETNTFGVIYDKSVRCALWMKKYGINRNDIIGSCSANNMNSCIPFLATLYIGSIFNPWWNSCLDEELAKYFIEQTRPKIIFADDISAKIILKIINDIDYNVKIIVYGKILGLESFNDILNQVNINNVQTFECTTINDVNESALILYTSGTTSNPKGALHSYGSVASMIGPTTNKSNISLWFSSLCWLSGVISTVSSILTQSTMIVYDSPSELVACQLIDKFKITRLSMGTAVANRLSKTKEVENYDLSSIKLASFAGSIAKKEVVEFLFKIFKNSYFFTAYGSTECLATGGIVNLDKPTSCGRINPNHEIKIIDLETNEILGPNKQGEIYCRGSAMMKCYFNNQKATSEAIDIHGWYHTGDIGYYDEDGDFFIVERIKELIKYRLHHVPPTAIESVIQDIPGVAEVAVVAKPHIYDQEQPTAFITKIPGIQLTEDEIHEVVKNKLHDRMKLRGGIYFIDKMPHTMSGKIAKRKLRALAKIQAD